MPTCPFALISGESQFPADYTRHLFGENRHYAQQGQPYLHGDFLGLFHHHALLRRFAKTSAALSQLGVPMKKEIEGAPGSALRQTATEAVTIDVPIMVQGQLTTMPWTYAYFELAQRDWSIDPATNRRYRFEGFLGAQATQLFEMTRVK